MNEPFFQTQIPCPLRHTLQCVPHLPARLVWDKARQDYYCPVCHVSWTPDELDRALQAQEPDARAEGGVRR